MSQRFKPGQRSKRHGYHRSFVLDAGFALSTGYDDRWNASKTKMFHQFGFFAMEAFCTSMPSLALIPLCSARKNNSCLSISATGSAVVITLDINTLPTASNFSKKPKIRCVWHVWLTFTPCSPNLTSSHQIGTCNNLKNRIKSKNRAA